ncbi:hypothetical protein [Myxosarcina sp. GI1]|uniref:hypothetical protein n=1 Tax=Myxosarcina sp. GI1 TaxID=1541065 RepID=UPI0012E0AAEB|nr:hypothetical protein [Myxosarcina sp. GI1]
MRIPKTVTEVSEKIINEGWSDRYIAYLLVIVLEDSDSFEGVLKEYYRIKKAQERRY